MVSAIDRLHCRSLGLNVNYYQHIESYSTVLVEMYLVQWGYLQAA